MGHVKSAHLVELALGRTAGTEDAGALRHIGTCPRCRAEFASVTRVVAAARDAEAADLPTAPPGRVWRRIVQELSSQERSPQEPSREATAPPRPGRRTGRRLRVPWWRRGW